jgi:hypothetical protein
VSVCACASWSRLFSTSRSASSTIRKSVTPESKRRRASCAASCALVAAVSRRSAPPAFGQRRMNAGAVVGRAAFAMLLIAACARPLWARGRFDAQKGDGARHGGTEWVAGTCASLNKSRRSARHGGLLRRVRWWQVQVSELIYPAKSSPGSPFSLRPTCAALAVTPAHRRPEQMVSLATSRVVGALDEHLHCSESRPSRCAPIFLDQLD